MVMETDRTRPFPIGGGNYSPKLVQTSVAWRNDCGRQSHQMQFLWLTAILAVPPCLVAIIQLSRHGLDFLHWARNSVPRGRYQATATFAPIHDTPASVVELRDTMRGLWLTVWLEADGTMTVDGVITERLDVVTRRRRRGAIERASM